MGFVGAEGVGETLSVLTSPLGRSPYQAPSFMLTFAHYDDAS